MTITNIRVIWHSHSSSRTNLCNYVFATLRHVSLLLCLAIGLHSIVTITVRNAKSVRFTCTPPIDRWCLLETLRKYRVSVPSDEIGHVSVRVHLHQSDGGLERHAQLGSRRAQGLRIDASLP